MATVTSSPSPVVSATVTVTEWWLKAPTNSALNTTVDVPVHETARAEAQGVYRPLGRTRPLVVADALQGEDGTLVVELYDEASYDAFEALRNAQVTLLLVSPFEDQWYVRLGAVRRSSFTFGAGGTRVRTVTVDYVNVDRPS